jgi:hypothetical protein
MTAFAMCRVYTSETVPGLIECDVDRWNHTVSFTMAGLDDVAIDLCPTVAQIVHDNAPAFAGQGWHLQFISPYSNGTPIARCPLY